MEVAEEAKEVLAHRMHRVTGGHVPAATNVAALKRWLVDQGVDLRRPADPFDTEPEEADDEDDDEEDAKPELRRADVLRLLAGKGLTPAAREALTIRLEAGKSSVAKVQAILNRADEHGRCYGLLAYHGAATGRDSAAGSGVQAQNFPRDGIEAVYPGCTWDSARDALDAGAEAVDTIIGPPLDVISRMLRGAILPEPGEEIISADFSAVELRGVAWLAGQHDLVEDLRRGAKVYEEMGGVIFGRDPKEITKDSRERWVGKQTVLGSGYQMGPWKFWSQCMLLGQPVEPAIAIRSIAAFRERYPRIPQLWYGLNDAAIAAVQNPRQQIKAASGRVIFHYDDRTGWLRMRLPSGSTLRYRNPRIEMDEKYGREGVVFDGMHPKTKQWGKRRGFGGFWTENGVQRICRDLMMLGDARVTAAGYRPILRVHDELVRGARIGWGSTEEVVRLMCILPDWAEGFPLTAEAWRGARYG
jgi:DNA polymerase